MGDLLDKYTGMFSPTKNESSRKKDQQNTIEEEVYNYLRNAILTGVLTPGHRLLEAEIEDLMEKTGVNRAMIREALIRLVGDHLIEYQPYKGFTVSVLELDDLREIYFLRSVLEGSAARLACRNLTEQELENLGDLCNQMEACLTNNEISEMSRLNTDFHESIYQAANSPRLYKIIVQLWNGFLHSSLSFLTLRAPASVKEHHAIYEALKNRDGELAEKITREHLSSALDDLEEYWSQRLKD